MFAVRFADLVVVYDTLRWSMLEGMLSMFPRLDRL